MKQLPKTISIFPLSNFIFFPQTTVPLNIFEPRYIQMVDDAMKADRIIGMIQPKKIIKLYQFYIMLDVLVKLQVLMKQKMEGI